jgi:hypothetical protein
MRIVKIAAVAAVAAIGLALPGAALAQSGGIIQLGDTALTCPQIAIEANELTRVLGGAPEGGVFTSEQAISAATSVAMQGAIMSGAGRMLPGVGLLGSALGAAARRDRERREAERLTAQQRWYYLNGLYSGRNCDTVLAQSASAPGG